MTLKDLKKENKTGIVITTEKWRDSSVPVIYYRDEHGQITKIRGTFPDTSWGVYASRLSDFLKTTDKWIPYILPKNSTWSSIQKDMMTALKAAGII